ncbi:MAG TPA: PASTA domain-containing protein [Ignavibacteriaceae bacterium]|nr:PASTA domain-containing protein [Ignavibacteriaceae bacterium]
MKKNLQNPVVKKILWILFALIVAIVLFDNIFLPWYVSSPIEKVPDVVGKNETEAVSLLESRDLEPIVGDTTYDEKFPEGSIIFQRPRAGETVKEGRRVYLFVSGGEPVVHVPQLTGKSIRDAKFSLERLGLKLGNIDQEPSDYPKDMIYDQQFAEGTPVKRGESVNVTVSSGRMQTGSIEVPDLIGKSLSEAEKILADSSLKVGKINYQPSFSLLPNTILDQYPSRGNMVNPGDAVDLFVTKTANENEIKEE